MLTYKNLPIRDERDARAVIMTALDFEEEDVIELCETALGKEYDELESDVEYWQERSDDYQRDAEDYSEILFDIVRLVEQYESHDVTKELFVEGVIDIMDNF